MNDLGTTDTKKKKSRDHQISKNQHVQRLLFLRRNKLFIRITIRNTKKGQEFHWEKGLVEHQQVQ